MGFSGQQFGVAEMSQQLHACTQDIVVPDKSLHDTAPMSPGQEDTGVFVNAGYHATAVSMYIPNLMPIACTNRKLSVNAGWCARLLVEA